MMRIVLLVFFNINVSPTVSVIYEIVIGLVEFGFQSESDTEMPTVMKPWKTEEVNEVTMDSPYTDTTLCTILKPLFVPMMFMGLFHTKPITLKSRPFWRRISPSEAFCFIIVLFQFLNMIRYFYGNIHNGKLEFGPELFFTGMFLSWLLFCAVNALACFKACNKEEALPSFFKIWNHNKALQTTCFKYAKKWTMIFVLISLTLVVTNFLLCMYAVIFTDTGRAFYAPMDDDDDNIVVVYVFVGIAFAFLSGSSLLPVALQLLLCLIMKNEFTSLTQRITEIIDKNDMEELKKELEQTRRQHRDLCKLVEHADSFLAGRIGMSFATMILGICLIVYNIIWYPGLTQAPTLFVASLYWLFQMVVVLIIDCIGPAGVNSAAHSAFDVIHGINFEDDMSWSMVAQIQMFTSRTSGSSIGLTAIHMFIIDREMIITLFGLLITYFVLLVQFKPSTTNTDFQELLSNVTWFCQAYNSTCV